MKIPDDVRRSFEKGVGPIDRLSIAIDPEGRYAVSDRVTARYHKIDTENVVADLNARLDLYVAGYREAMARVKERLAAMKK